MEVETPKIVFKSYDINELLKHWIPLVIKGDEPNLDGMPNGNQYELDSANYDLVYTIQEDDSKTRYAYFYFDIELGMDNITKKYTLKKVVLDELLTEGNGYFFQGIVGSLTADSKFEYRVCIDKLDLPLKRYNKIDNIKKLTERFLARLDAKFTGTETDYYLKDIGLIK